MKLVLLTGTNPESEVQQRYVAKILAEAFPDDLKAIVVVDPPPVPLWKRVRTYWNRYSAREFLSRVRAKLRDRLIRRGERRQAAYRRILFPEGESGLMPRRDLIRRVPSHNGKRCLELLAAVKPDVIAVYGTVVIKEKVVVAARKGILNMHTGISPRYRGSDTIFWALHNEEPEWVGVTIHRLDAGIDSGAILATAKPEITTDDDEDTLFAKCVKLGCQHYVEAIRALANGTAKETPQDLTQGREYRFVDRTVAADKKVERLLADGLLARYATRSA
jgi:folate-dependent phosphoribosylglycinamide formyltransferase PurN